MRRLIEIAAPTRSSRAESRDSWSIRHQALTARSICRQLAKCLSTPLEANGALQAPPSRGHWPILVLLLSGCGGASENPGLEAWLRVSGAQYQRGSLTPGSGPALVALDLSRSAVTQGDSDLHISGTLAPEANAVALWLEGDRGFWVLPAGLPDVTVPDDPTFAVTAELARDAPAGARTLQVAALSREGVAGPLTSAALQIRAPQQPGGALIISLRWDTNADLDLHVVDAAGVEIWARNPNSWQAVPGAPPDPNAWKQGGLLDLDSNGQCVIDGRNQERVVWTSPPPAGHYLVRVDAFSMCGQSAANWNVEVDSQGQPLAAARGVATTDSSRPPHDLGAGVLAVEFDLP